MGIRKEDSALTIKTIGENYDALLVAAARDAYTLFRNRLEHLVPNFNTLSQMRHMGPAMLSFRISQLFLDTSSQIPIKRDPRMTFKYFCTPEGKLLINTYVEQFSIVLDTLAKEDLGLLDQAAKFPEFV